MPQLIEHPEQLALARQRDVLFVSFPELHPLAGGAGVASYPPRHRLIRFLDRHGIPWRACALPRSPTAVLDGYCGALHLDCPFDPADPHYRLVQRRLERPDGSLRDPRIRFWCMTLAEARRRAGLESPEL